MRLSNPPQSGTECWFAFSSVRFPHPKSKTIWAALGVLGPDLRVLILPEYPGVKAFGPPRPFTMDIYQGTSGVHPRVLK